MKNWFRENRFLGSFALAGSVALIAALSFFFNARGSWSDANARWQNDVNELARLQRLEPLPSGDNLRKMKVHAEDYTAALHKLRDDMKARVLPVVSVAPSEFQSRLRVAMGAIGERARANKVKLPENFFLGFDEFASSLPSAEAAPSLAQELAQAELLLNSLIDARVDAITAFRRVPVDRSATMATPGPAVASATRRTQGAAALDNIDRATIETSFVSSPAAARRALNAITTAEKQFYIVRLLHVRNEKDKGPSRDAGAATETAAVVATPASKAASLNFIVGSEKIETAARIEMLRFNL